MKPLWFVPDKLAVWRQDHAEVSNLRQRAEMDAVAEAFARETIARAAPGKKITTLWTGRIIAGRVEGGQIVDEKVYNLEQFVLLKDATRGTETTILGYIDNKVVHKRATTVAGRDLGPTSPTQGSGPTDIADLGSPM